MKITVTLREILHAPTQDAWDRFCKRYGYNPWILNEGLATGEEEVEISPDEAYEYGLIEGIGI